MALTDFTSKRTISHPTDLFRQSSLSDEMQEKHQKLSYSNKHHQNKKIKTLHLSVLDIVHRHRPTDTFENQNTDQQQESSPFRPSIIKSSDIERIFSKKSVTFATVFDTIEDEPDEDEIEPNTNHKMVPEVDLVTVIVNKHFDDETPINTNETTESYPFRSEIPLSSQSNLPIDVTTNSHHPRKKILHHFIPPSRPKKLRHPIEMIDSLSTMNRSNSAPNLSVSSPLPLPPITTVTTNDQQSPLQTIRTWFKLSAVGRFVQSFSKNSRQNKNISKTKTKPRHQSTGKRRFSEVLY